MTVTFVDGLVVARSTYNTDINYRSVVIIGQATEVKDLDEKRDGLEPLVEHIIPGRSRDARPANREGAAQHHAVAAAAHRVLGQGPHRLARRRGRGLRPDDLGRASSRSPRVVEPPVADPALRVDAADARPTSERYRRPVDRRGLPQDHATGAPA